jgi:5-methyltetrahydrofolate--homocysteine methyltransferase
MSKSKIVVMDGAMGTMLLAHGVPPGACFEALNLSRPDLVREIHRSYLDAGAEAVLANTFGANRPRLSIHRLANRLEAFNRAGVRLARQAAGRRPVFASVGPLGHAAKRMRFPEMFRAFKEQARALEKESPAGYVIETMTSLTEAEAATAAVRQVSDGTIIALLSRPLKLTPQTAELVSATLRSAGADAIGANCGASPEDDWTILTALRRADEGPFAVRISGGLPGRTLSPAEFAAWGLQFKKLGCTWIGGCCGTTPAHTRALREIL